MISLNDLAQLEWRNLWWLLLAAQPFAIAALANLKRTQALNYADRQLRPWAITRLARRPGQRWSKMVTAFAWLALACAAAGPRLPLTTDASKSGMAQPHDIDIMVALDVSASMQATDIAPQRLQRAKLEITDIVERLHGEQIGLIAFAGTAGLLAPPTHDYVAFAHYLNLAGPELFTLPGSNLAAALELAGKQLPPHASKAGAVLLVTDGEVDALNGARGIAASRAAVDLKQQGTTIYVLVAASRAGAAITAPGSTAPVISRPDENALRQLAEPAGGGVSFISDGDADGQAVYEQGLLRLPGAPAREVRAWQELYPYFLLAALLLLMLPVEFIRRFKPAAQACVLLSIAIVTGSYSNPAQADDLGDAYTAYREQNYSLAQILYHQQRSYDARLGEGAAAYRRQRYAEAVELFTASLFMARDDNQRADALFNLGNSYFQGKNFQAAVDAYEGSLTLRAGDSKTSANLELALARLEKTSKPGPEAAGIPGRRSRRLVGTALEENNSDVPVDFDTTRERMEPDISRDAAVNGAANATANEPVLAPAPRYISRDAQRDYRAALKKLELITDQPGLALKELIKLDTPREAKPVEQLPPW